MAARLKNLSIRELETRLNEMGEPSFRMSQIMRWVYQKNLVDFAGMNNVAKPTRAALAREFSLAGMPALRQLVSANRDAIKFEFGLLDSEESVESVLLFDGKRRTACLSSQLGCGLGCVFCATGTMGLVRNLTQDEILGQLIGINDHLAASGDIPVTHIVFMGMGEALSNFAAFKSSCEIIMHPDGFHLSGKRITVSTAGVVPSIDRLLRDGPSVNLAISLNTYCDEKRDRLMPVNKTYPIADLIAAAKRFRNRSELDLTFEYVVCEGENDGPEAVKELCRLLGGLACKVNVIPLNPNAGYEGRGPAPDKAWEFADRLFKKGIVATVRTSRGRDIDGACGQLVTGRRPVTP